MGASRRADRPVRTALPLSHGLDRSSPTSRSCARGIRLGRVASQSPEPTRSPSRRCPGGGSPAPVPAPRAPALVVKPSDGLHVLLRHRHAQVSSSLTDFSSKAGAVTASRVRAAFAPRFSAGARYARQVAAATRSRPGALSVHSAKVDCAIHRRGRAGSRPRGSSKAWLPSPCLPAWRPWPAPRDGTEGWPRSKISVGASCVESAGSDGRRGSASPRHSRGRGPASDARDQRPPRTVQNQDDERHGQPSRRLSVNQALA